MHMFNLPSKLYFSALYYGKARAKAVMVLIFLYLFYFHAFCFLVSFVLKQEC